MASVVPTEQKKLLDIKLGELPGWILMWDFTPSDTAGAFQEVTTGTTGTSAWRKVASSGFHGTGSLCALQLLPFPQGAQAGVAAQVPLRRDPRGGHSALLATAFLARAPLRLVMAMGESGPAGSPGCTGCMLHDSFQQGPQHVLSERTPAYNAAQTQRQKA
ncbi:hypothetical protein P7K49_027195 [Saguinus oedipus]|uniref:ATP synthase membrane subunit f n=1 Tax=Saguinus oedipus TaxID=9490 RepID=A0ABQ9UFA3_SAGOE|nr:hypothetical protein P7K49_027195 [Saguinus oedipus]